MTSSSRNLVNSCKFYYSFYAIIFATVAHGNSGTVQPILKNLELDTSQDQSQGQDQQLISNVNSEDVQVYFLTKLRNTREIHKHDFHILKIKPTSDTSSAKVKTIHLTRSENLLSSNFTVSINNGTTSREIHESLLSEFDSETLRDSTGFDYGHCIYSGVLSGTKDEIFGLTSATLSACGEQPGFTGFIMTNEGSYLLEPKTVLKTEEEGHNNGILHTLTLIKSDESVSPTCGGVIYSNIAKETDQLPVENGTTIPHSSDSRSESDATPYNNRRLNDGINHSPIKLKPKLRFPKGKSGEKKVSKVTEERSDNRIIELAVFAEHSFLELHRKTLKTKSLKVVTNFILLLVQATADFFQLSSLDSKMTVQVVHMELMTKNPSSLNTHHGLYISFLDSFCKFSSKLNHDYSKWDHAMMLTGLDLRSEDSDNIVGVAYTNAMCSSQSCSLVEATNFHSPKTMAHELGHSLGMGHDGENANKDCPNNKYVMAAISTPKQNAWSSCSNQNMKTYLSKLESGSFRQAKSDCLKSPVTKSADEKHNYKFASQLPGEKFTSSDQCLMYDKEYPNPVTDSLISRFGLKDSMCKQLYCAASSWKTAMFAHAALEGTECATGKWCRNSECVKKY